MPDEFGTVNMKPRSAERTREIEVIRQHYGRHREALEQMVADAPTEYLAGEYRRLIQEIDLSFAKLEELEGRTTAAPARATAAAALDPQAVRRTEPGGRTLNPPPSPAYAVDDDSSSGPSRVVLIVIAGVLVLAVIGWLLWRASSDERPSTPVVETAPISDTVPAASPPVTAMALAVEPPSQDFGVVRKGTRAARQFEVVNNTDAPISIDVARSACRCLYYDHAQVIPPNGRETLTVTVDGSKAGDGQLSESVQITSDADASVATSFDVLATIR